MLMDIEVQILNRHEATKQIKITLPQISIIAQIAYAPNNDKINAL